jgi:3-methyladenine DNA glycosylase AlkD
MTYQEIIKELRSQRNQKNIDGMARFGINPKNTLGVSIYILRPLAKRIGKDHKLAGELWDSEIHEARILASYIDEPEKVTEKQMDEWVADFDSWDTCDQVVDLFERTPFAYKKVYEWAKRDEEFVKRASFAMMAGLVVHDKKSPDSDFENFFPIILREATDDRNFVKKAVNWALRNIGKWKPNLKEKAIKTAEEMIKKYPDSKSARWIAKDAIRELSSR